MSYRIQRPSPLGAVCSSVDPIGTRTGRRVSSRPRELAEQIRGSAGLGAATVLRFRPLRIGGATDWATAAVVWLPDVDSNHEPTG